MSGDAVPTEFRSKTWIYHPLIVIFGSLAVFSLIFGPLFLIGVLRNAKGAPATDGGIALCAVSVPFVLITALVYYNLRARQRPVLRLCREGIEVVIIGSSSLDEIPLIPGLVRVVWAILSTQGFRRKVFCFPWECLQEAYVSGLPMLKQLTIVASRSFPNYESFPKHSYFANELVLAESAFDGPLNQIADAIRWYANSPQSFCNLPSWHAS